jgi:DMSO reductase anchor subunit
MTTTSSHPVAGFYREWPLVVFTTLAIMGAGLLATPLAVWLVTGTTAPAAGAVRWGALLLGAGLAVSTAHLGRPFRAPLASVGIGRSRLSAEVVVAAVALILGIVTALLPDGSELLGFATAAAALAFLVALGLVYALPGQQTWRGAPVWMPLTESLGFSLVALSAMWSGRPVPIGVAAVGILAADAALLTVRRMSLTVRRTPLAPKYPSVLARRDPILVSRLALVDVLPPCFLLAGLPAVAAGLLGLGILLDRVAFYGFASQHTTEAEVLQVERIMAS